MGDAEWRSRLRWRTRGATQWPVFVMALIAVAVLLHALPVAGDNGPDLFPALLLSGFFCLIVVAVAGPLAAVWLRRRRPGLPKVVADDQAGTVLLGVLVALVLVAGLVHRPAVQQAGDAFSAQAAQARRYILVYAPPAYHANVGRLDTWKQGDGLYRTCAPGPDPSRAFCVLVNTDQQPPGIVRDPDQRPNSVVAGPGNPGRRPG